MHAVCMYPSIWAGGVSYSGIADMEGFARGTHSFEKGYTQLLVGPLPTDVDDKGLQAERQLYRDRSPVSHAENLMMPLLMIFGKADQIVPSRQADDMREAVESSRTLRNRDGVVRLLGFEKEGHVLSDPEIVRKRILEEEMWWARTLLKLGDTND